MSISAYPTMQIDHGYEPLYLAIYGHEKPGGGEHARGRCALARIVKKESLRLQKFEFLDNLLSLV